MKKILMTAILTSISEVMETMFFLPVEFGRKSTLSQCGISSNESHMAAQLLFTGDASGCLTLVASKPLVAEMAENFMGDPREQLSDEHLSGTLTEMLNMVCGNALSKVESQVPFELGIPKVIEASEILSNDVFTCIETPLSNMAVCMTLD